MSDLFDIQLQNSFSREAPLADRMRPRDFSEFAGQAHLVEVDKPIRRMVEKDYLTSSILWGPPGTGKTTLAKIIAEKTKSDFVFFSAVTSGIPELRKIIKEAEERRKFYQKKTILFVDEIHRLNKAQQDAFLPHTESGLFILIGATTENPSFEVINALLSRCQVYVLNRLEESDLKKVLDRVLADSVRGLGNLKLKIDPQAEIALINFADGDARRMLNLLELCAKQTKVQSEITLETVAQIAQKKTLLYDQAGEEHYNLISAFIKSMRGSDPDAAIYYLARIIESGEDPLFLARRMVIFASEDIGNADPEALKLAIAVKEAVNFVGLPEAAINLAHGVTYLACAPKSNASYVALRMAQAEVKNSGALPVPLHLRNAPTKMMKELGYGKNYEYAHDQLQQKVSHAHLPEKLKGRIFYKVKKNGILSS